MRQRNSCHGPSVSPFLLSVSPGGAWVNFGLSQSLSHPPLPLFSVPPNSTDWRLSMTRAGFQDRHYR